jgi:Restriction endonuclease S subunits
MHWITGKLSDLVEINPPIKLVKGKEYPFVSMDVINPGKKIVEAKEYRNFSGGGSRFQNNDTLFARITPCLENGKISQVRHLDGEVGFGSTEFLVFRGKQGITDTEFVYYFVTNHSFRLKAIQLMVGTSGRQRVDHKKLSDEVFTIPPLPIQRKIAEILGSLDDKIEINRRMNETFEQMAMALYKHWFVEFGPFQDEEFVDSEIGNIPACFSLSTIGKAVKVIGGGTPSTKVNEYWENGEINWFTPTDLTSSKTLFITKSAKRITEKGLNESSAKLFPAYSVMMTSRATIGVIAINREPASTNQGFIVLIPNEKFPTFYLYLWLKNNLGSIHSISNGSTFLEVNRGNFKELPIIESDKVLEFSKQVEPILSQIETLTIESETLIQTRDYLLPRLLSGEIELKEAEEQVEEVLANA